MKNKMSIRVLGFNTRTLNALHSANIYTIGELQCLTENMLLRISGFGRKSLKEVLDACSFYDIELLDAKMDRLREQYTLAMEEYKKVSDNNFRFVRGEKRGIELMEYKERIILA